MALIPTLGPWFQYFAVHKMRHTYNIRRIPPPGAWYPCGTINLGIGLDVTRLWSRANFFGNCRSDQSWERLGEEIVTTTEGRTTATRRHQGRYDEVGRDDCPVGHAACHVSYATEIHLQCRCLTKEGSH